MKTGSPYFDNIGSALHAVASTQLMRKYGIPHYYACPGYTNSKLPDIQSGYERATHALIGALAGYSPICLHGGIYGEITAHPVFAIIDDDLAGMIGRFLEGIEVNDDTLCVDLINEVGPIPGYYLNKEHTRNWWRKEQYTQSTADILTYPEWVNSGKKSCLEYAKTRMDEILTTHVPNPLNPKQEKIVEDVLKEAREYYRKKGKISDSEWSNYMRDIKSPDYPFG
jgi:trimethylamine--corrinoid protein Co-methyltransferase